MKDSLTRFSDRVENYIKYRPGYPDEIITFLKQNIGLSESWSIADIGSGTGISAELFLKNGNRVYAVEPNQPMREAAETLLSKYPDFKSINGTAENTTLAASNIDLIVAAQAFHWFKADVTRTEFKRILKPAGKVLLIWNERKTDTTPFLIAYEDLLHEFATDYKEVNHKNIEGEKIASFFGHKNYLSAVFPNEQEFNFEGLKGRLLSSSYVPEKGQPKYELMLEKLREVYQAHQQNDNVMIEYDTKIFVGELS